MIKEYEREFLFVVGGFKCRCCKKQGYFLGTVIGLGRRAGGGFQGVSPLHRGVWGDPPITKKGGVLGGLPPNRVLLKSTNLDYNDYFFIF